MWDEAVSAQRWRAILADFIQSPRVEGADAPQLTEQFPARVHERGIGRGVKRTRAVVHCGPPWH